MKFEFSTTGRIVFGPGASEQVPGLVAGYGRRAFLVLGSRSDRFTPILDHFAACGIAWECCRITGEPTIEIAQAAVEFARRAQAEVVLALGGGSVLDTGKVIAAMLTNGGDLSEYLEVVGQGKPLRNPAAPCIAVPTTAGTGAEVTYNAVLGVPQQRVKVSIRSPLMLPRWAVVDPLLTHSLPPELTASTGLDALTQLIEAFVSNQANPLTDGICREGLHRAGRSLQRAFEDGGNAAAREDMAIASLLSGMALANAKLGAVHGFAGPLGGMTRAPHGVICGKLLPYVMQANVRALRDRAPNTPALARFDEVARILTAQTMAQAADAVAWIEKLCAALALPGLRGYALDEEDFPAVVAKARGASSMKGNPISLDDQELHHILRQVID
ncbi:MAG: iron-containing alcohol dehydrogenase [Planctomycetes bacterium]|nr:iron-containing alcohol dehydrogenase [Planctomycetota bacterium]